MIKYVRLGSTIIPHYLKNVWWINKYSKKPLDYSKDVDGKEGNRRQKLVRSFLKKCMKGFRVQFYVGGIENLPDTPVLLTPNHQSMMDPVCLLGLDFRNLSFLSKKEVEKFPIIGKIVKVLGGVFIERDNIRQEIKAISKVSDEMENNTAKPSFCIFPEGTRTKDPDMKLGEFKAGALKPAYNLERTIVPVAIFGTFRILDQKEHLKKYPVQIQFLKPHLPSEFENTPTTEMAKIIQEEIAIEVEKMKKRDEILMKRLNG